MQRRHFLDIHMFDSFSSTEKETVDKKMMKNFIPECDLHLFYPKFFYGEKEVEHLRKY